MIHRVTQSLDFGRNTTAFISWPLFVDNCRRRDEIWPDMSTKKSVLDDGTNVCNLLSWSFTVPGLATQVPSMLWLQCNNIRGLCDSQENGSLQQRSRIQLQATPGRRCLWGRSEMIIISTVETLYKEIWYNKLFSAAPIDLHMTSSLGVLPWGCIGLRVNAVVRNVPVADHKHVQSNGLYPQLGGVLISVHKIYEFICFVLYYLLTTAITKYLI